MERLTVYNENGEDTGRVIVRGVDELKSDEYILAAIMVVHIGDKFLITKRDKNKTCAGMWEFPGGAVLSHETSLEGGIRELKEETGLSAASDKFNYLGQLISKKNKLLMDIYEVEANSHIKLKDIKLQQGETAEAKIISVDAIDGMYDNLTESDQMIFDEFVVCMDEDYD